MIQEFLNILFLPATHIIDTNRFKALSKGLLTYVRTDESASSCDKNPVVLFFLFIHYFTYTHVSSFL